MRAITGLLLLGVIFSQPIHSASIDSHTPNPNDIQVVPMTPTPMPENVELKIVYPSSDELQAGKPLRFQTRLDWLPLGVDSDFDRKNEIYNDKKGQSLHIFIDDREYFQVNEALFDALDDHDQYYTQTADFVIPFKLEPGQHVIRMFACRSFGESLKSDKAYAAMVFYYKKRENTIKDLDLSAPYITYNEPQDAYKGSQPILLDFFVSNCVLSKDGYKVKLTIDGDMERTLTDWVPYYIHGLKKGSHKIRLQLLDPQNKLVKGPFNDIERKIVLK